MHDHVALSDHVAPRHLWMAFAQLRRESPCRLAVCSKPPRLPFDLLARAFARIAQPACRRYVHWAAQQLFQVTLKTRLLEQAPLLLDLDQHIQIAVRPRFATGDRSEHPHPMRAVTGGQTLNLVPPPTQLPQAGRRTGWARVWVRLTPAIDLAPKLAQPVQRRIAVPSPSAHMPQGKAYSGRLGPPVLAPPRTIVRSEPRMSAQCCPNCRQARSVRL